VTDARNRILGPLKEKLPDASSTEDLTDAQWNTAEVDQSEEFKLEIQVDDEQTRETVVQQLESKGISVGSAYGRVIKTRATARQVFNIAETANVEKIFEELPTKVHAVSEGVGVSNADDAQSNGLTGAGVKAAIIDLDPNSGGGFWPESHKDYGGNIVDKIQSGPNEDTYFIEQAEMHGTGCTEVVHDMAPDAELVLCAYNGNDDDGDIPSMLRKIEQQHPDTAAVSISLGSAPTDRLDGQDSISQEIEKFTTEGETSSDPSQVSAEAERGRVCAISAGNEAAGNVWHGQYQDAGDGTMIFEDGEDYLEIQNAEAGTFIIANWDSWDESNQNYSIALYEDAAKTSEVGSTSTFDNFAYMQVPDAADGQSAYFEVTQESASRNHEFDIWLFANSPNMQIAKYTPDRSISIPATTRATTALTTAAIQATDFGVESSAGDLKVYSSRGPTRDDRDGVNIAGPSRVSQTDQAYGTADSNLDPNQGFNGTSAAAPHIAGAATQLFELGGVDHIDLAQAIQNTGAGIPDSNVDQSDTTIVGGGYLDVDAARVELQSLNEPLQTKWTSNDLGGDPQYSTPAVDSNQVYVGGLQNTFYALSRDNGESVGWMKDRGNEPGLSDSSGHIWTDPSQNKIFFGSGQGRVFGVDTDDATEHWSGQDIPDLGSAVTASPTSDNSIIYAGTNDGRVLAWDAETANKEWEVTVDGPVYSDLVAADGLVYVTTKNGTLHVLDGATGAQQWSASPGGEFGASSPALGNGSVYVAADEVHAFDAASTKNKQWASSDYDGTAGSNPVYYGGSVYVGGADGDLYEVDASTGSAGSLFSTGGEIASTPAIDSSADRIAVPSTDGTLYLLDTAGTQQDAISIPADTRTSPVIDNGVLYLPTASGVVYAFE